MGRGYGRGRVVRLKHGWRGEWTDSHGRRHRKTLGETRSEAERNLSAIIARRDAELAGARVGNSAWISAEAHTLEPLVAAYLRHLEATRSASHYARTAWCIDRVTAALGVDRVDGLSVAALSDYAELRARSVSARSANLEAGSLKAALRWACARGLIQANPLENWRPMSTAGRTRRNRRALTEDELARVLVAAESRERPDDVPQVPMWHALAVLGLRFSELERLRWADLDPRAGLLTVRAETSKAKRPRLIPVPAGVLERLQGLRAAQSARAGRLVGGEDPMFLQRSGLPWSGRGRVNTAYRELRRLLEVAGIERVDASGRTIDLHALRATAATRMARAGVPLAHAQALLGHSTPTLTARHYVHLGAEDLRGSVADVTISPPQDSASRRESQAE